MQLYVGDYLADTLHLTTEQHGAYLLLLMTMWRAGACLPNDPAKLARICRVSPKRWPSVWAEISEFFEIEGNTITNNRLTKEHQKAVSISQERKAAGKKGGKANALKNHNAGEAIAEAGLKHSQISEPDIRIEDADDSAGAGELPAADPPPADLPADRERILEAMGVGPDGVVGASKFIGGQGDMAEAARWLELPGITLDVALCEIRSVMARKGGGAPSKFSYFTPAMQELSAKLTAPPLQPAAGHQPRASPSAAPRIRARLPSEITPETMQ